MSEMDRLEQTTFTAMRDATRDDYQTIAQHSVGFFSDLPNRVLKHLEILAGDTGGYAVDRLTHSLQTATRAQRDGRDDEYVVCAVLHDIGDSLACVNHAQLAATVLQPFVSAKNHWIVEHHGIFQGYYFFHHLGLDRNMRDQFREHPYWKDCAEFCEKYDQNSFDPDYETLPLEHFEPLVQKVFAAPRKSMYMPEEPGAVGGSRSD
jgi:predicted HD phosphohydrolase